MHYQLKVHFAKDHDLSIMNSASVSCHIAIEVHFDVRPVDTHALDQHLNGSLKACIEMVTVADSYPRRSNGAGSADAASSLTGRFANINIPSAGSTTVKERLRTNGSTSMNRDTSPVEAASRGQRRAINAVCHRLNISPAVAADNHHFELRSLTKRQASMLINQLRNLERNPSHAKCYFREDLHFLDPGCHAGLDLADRCQRCVARSA